MAHSKTISRDPMPEDDARIIRENYVYLVDNIDATHLINHLYQDNTDKETMTSDHDKNSRNRKLLDILIKRGINAFSCFMAALRKNGYELASIRIMKTSKRIVKNRTRITAIDTDIEVMRNQIKQLKMETSNQADIIATRIRKIVQLNKNLKEVTAERSALMQEIEQIRGELASVRSRTDRG